MQGTDPARNTSLEIRNVFSGQGFAKAELACLLATWIGTFKTALSDPNFVPEIMGGISVKPRGGLHVVVKRVDWR